MLKKSLWFLLFSILFFVIITPITKAENNSEFKFVTMGSAYLSLCEPEDYELIISKIKKYNPDFVLFLGGMVGGYEVKSKKVEKLWHKLHEGMSEKLNIPVYDIPGWFHSKGIIVNSEMAKKNYLNSYKKLYYNFNYKNNLFICLNSESNGEIIKGKQQQFLKKSLSDSSKYNNIFLAIHAPLWKGNSYNSNWRKDIIPIIKGKVDYVFSSDNTPAFFAPMIEGTRYILSGSCPVMVNSYIFHFLLVTVKADDTNIQIVPLKPLPIEKLPQFKPRVLKESQVLPFKKSVLKGRDRKSILMPRKIINKLNIKPGMKIVDIGAGTGMFSYLFSKAMEGKGKVFATECDREILGHIKKRVKNEGFDNVHPVYVSPEGVDSFYKKHKFDIIFACELYQDLYKPGKYFKGLRSSLKDNGRLYLIHFKVAPDVSGFEYGNFQDVMRVLSIKGEEFPVFKKVSRKVKNFIRNWREREVVPQHIQKKLVEDFNNILNDTEFYPQLLSYYTKEKSLWIKPFSTFINYDSMPLVNWLVVQLRKSKVFGKKINSISNLNMERLRMLNRVLLNDILHSDRFRKIKGFNVIFDHKENVISTLEKAGYKLVKEHDILPVYHLLEFKKGSSDK